MKGGQALLIIMVLGSIVIGIFSFVILLYTNSFLMKRRKKELGLYNILGMGKTHIARVMTLEIIDVAVGTIAAGLLLGILLSKIMLMLLFKILTFKVLFGFEVSPVAVIITTVLFVGIFALTLLLNVGRVHQSKPIELLYGGNFGEKEPKTKWLLTVIGLLALGSGYTIAIVINAPLQALLWFFVAVILVIAGTYCLFTSGSIALLKSLRGNKNYYYKMNHFASVSGMIYRMKQNAAGLATICILSTMILVMISTTVSLYIGMEGSLRNRFPRNIEITAANMSQAESNSIGRKADEIIQQSGIIAENSLQYRFRVFTLTGLGTGFSFPGADKIKGPVSLFFIPLDDYNKMQGTTTSLSENELLLYSPNTAFVGKSVTFKDKSYTVKSVLTELIARNYALEVNDTYYLIMPDEQSIESIYSNLTGGKGGNKLSYYYGFDAKTGASGQSDLTNKLSNALVISTAGEKSEGKPVAVSGTEAFKDIFLNTYGGLFFLGLFLGALFLMATVIIMYYKQISEGYDDKKRFEIMQKVGLSRDEVKKTIQSQVLTVFFLPLLAAAINILAAFKMITRLLFLLNLTDISLFALCTLLTIVVFAGVYAVVYVLTARAYYKIVS